MRKKQCFRYVNEALCAFCYTTLILLTLFSFNNNWIGHLRKHCQYHPLFVERDK